MRKPQSQKLYRKHYLNINSCYPSVFALKFFLGRNPELNLANVNFSGKKILDIGFGDGRDLKLFQNLGLKTYGIEVDEEVVAHTYQKFPDKKNPLTLTTGFNDSTGYPSRSFDFVYSSAALMYLRSETITLQLILRHVHDILKKDGWFFGSFTKSDSHITEGAKTIDCNRLYLSDPFYKQREGQIYYVHHSKKEVSTDLENAGFLECKVFEYRADWFGTLESAFIFSARKRS